MARPLGQLGKAQLGTEAWSRVFMEATTAPARARLAEIRTSRKKELAQCGLEARYLFYRLPCVISKNRERTRALSVIRVSRVSVRRATVALLCRITTVRTNHVAAVRGSRVSDYAKFKILGEKPRDKDRQMEMDSRTDRCGNYRGNEKLLSNGERRPMPLSIPVLEDVHTADHESVTSYSSSMSSNATDSDMSSATYTELLSPEEHKRAMLDRLMDYFVLVHMNRKTAGEEVPAGISTPSSTSSTQVSSSGQTSEPTRRGATGKGKRLVSRDPRDESDSDGEEDGPPNSKRQKNGKVEQRRLACPFFKRNPQRYKEKRSCVAPGFRTVHRLKQVPPPSSFF